MLPSYLYFKEQEVLLLKTRKLFYKIKPPCSKCLYKRGVIETPVNPCPLCKLNGYQSFELFQKQLSMKKSVDEIH